MDVKGSYTASQIQQLSRNPDAVVDLSDGGKSASFKQRLVSLLPGHKQSVNLAGIRNFLQTNPDIKASGLKIDSKWLSERNVQKLATATMDLMFRAKLRGLENLVTTLKQSDLGPEMSRSEIDAGIDAATSHLRSHPTSGKDDLLTAAYKAIDELRLGQKTN